MNTPLKSTLLVRCVKHQATCLLKDGRMFHEVWGTSGFCDGGQFTVSYKADLRTALRLLAPSAEREAPQLTESRAQARDRGYRDAMDLRNPDSGYRESDRRPQASTRILAYFYGYGEGVFARREEALPAASDKDPQEGKV